MPAFPSGAYRRLFDIESPQPRGLTADEIHAAGTALQNGIMTILDLYLLRVDASEEQRRLARNTMADAIGDAIADASARQLRKIEDGGE